MKAFLQPFRVVVVAAILAGLPAGAVQAATVTITIDNFTFSPETVTIHAGDTVIWTNQDDIPHVVAEKDGKFRSTALDTGESYSRMFSAPGTVDYYCAIHPHMTGSVIAVDGGHLVATL